MIKIEEFRVNGYKNIKDADLKLGNINVLIGPNNSGKSNFIQILSFLNFVINSSNDDAERAFSNGFHLTYFKRIAPFGKDIFDAEKKGIISCELKFFNSETNRVFNYAIRIEWYDSVPNTKYKIVFESLDVKDANKTGKASSVFERKNEEIKLGSESSKTGIFRKLYVPNYLSFVKVLKISLPHAPYQDSHNAPYTDAVNCLNEIVKTPIFYFSNVQLLKIEEKEQINTFNGRLIAFDIKKGIIGLENGDNWEIFKSSLKDILGITNVEIFILKSDDERTKEEKHVFLEHFGVLKSIDDFSDGTILVIALILKVLSANNHIFLIEELENSIHPKALVDLLNFINSFSEQKQFIITSHSIVLLNKTKPDNVIINSINKEGHCELHNVSSKKELKKRLKQSSVNYSDVLFFDAESETEDFE